MMPTTAERSLAHASEEAELRSMLTSALDEEVDLLETLRSVFVAQREALAAGDPSALDDGVFAATRVLRTLDEARRRRLRLTEGLLGAQVGIEELDTLLTGSESRPVRLAQDRLRRAAGDLRGEVGLLRRILHVALTDNRRYLEALVGEAGHNKPADRYGPALDVPRQDAGGAVLDRTV